MINYISGDIFKDAAESIVNPVNCLGVMGKGLALAFKNKYPENYKVYRSFCDKKMLHPGEIFTHFTGHNQPKAIYNLATKGDWRENSKLSWINSGLENLIVCLKQDSINSVALPAIGCGLGGLQWKIVKNSIDTICGLIENVNFNVYLPY